MNVVKFRKEHLEMMRHQEAQKGLEFLETTELFDMLEGEDAYSIIDGEEVLCCAGVVKLNHGRGVAWAYLAEDIRNRMTTVTRIVKRYLGIADFHRIEMHVDCDFKEAHRWARMLGFEMECERMRAFTPDKRDCALYAMVR